ncbi:MAG: hypothetical protein R3F43_16980 [bacterium]
MIQALGGLQDHLAVAERQRAGRRCGKTSPAWLDALRVAEARQLASDRARAEVAAAQTRALSVAAAEGVEALQAPLHGIVDRIEGAVVTLTAAERQRAETLNDRLDAVVGQVQAITTRLERAEQERVAAFAAAVDRLRAATEVAATETAERGAARVELARAWRGELEAAEGRTASRLGQSADELARALATQVERFEAAQQARADGTGAVVERLGALVERLGQDAEEQTRRLAAGEAAAQARLAALAETLERTLVTQAERLAVLEKRLADAQGSTGRALAERLGAHAEDLGQRLSATGLVVREAADLLRGGGAELSAVAEMFTAAVDGYRETSERSLTALARLEEVLARTDSDAVGRMVGEYLDQTREIFGDAVRFQRELFTELRAVLPPREARAVGG